MLVEVRTVGNRGCDREETPPSAPDHTLASFTQSHKSFIQTEATLSRTFGKGVTGVETVAVVSSRRLLGKPKGKIGSGADKTY